MIHLLINKDLQFEASVTKLAREWNANASDNELPPIQINIVSESVSSSLRDLGVREILLCLLAYILHTYIPLFDLFNKLFSLVTFPNWSSYLELLFLLLVYLPSQLEYTSCAKIAEVTWNCPYTSMPVFRYQEVVLSKKKHKIPRNSLEIYNFFMFLEPELLRLREVKSVPWIPLSFFQIKLNSLMFKH